jgi:hypothetical protein
VKASYIPRMNRPWLERVVAGSIRSAIAAHGPIATNDQAASAAKRAVGEMLAKIEEQVAKEKKLRALAAPPAGGARENET